MEKISGVDVDGACGWGSLMPEGLRKKQRLEGCHRDKLNSECVCPISIKLDRKGVLSVRKWVSRAGIFILSSQNKVNGVESIKQRKYGDGSTLSQEIKWVS